jgi:hypothetical protein
MLTRFSAIGSFLNNGLQRIISIKHFFLNPGIP